MDRPNIVQSLLSLSEAPAYLEVGVNHGITFNAISARRKVAVDPRFNFQMADAKAMPNNKKAVYHEVTSDAYFADLKGPKDRFDVIFLDGLHTFDQTLRDLINALECLKPGGAIVIDDVMPSSYAASLPTMKMLFEFREACGIEEHSWMGDVYKLIFFIRYYMSHLSYALVAETRQQAVVWRAPRKVTEVMPDVADLASLPFSKAMIEKTKFNPVPLQKIVQAVRASAPGGRAP